MPDHNRFDIARVLRQVFIKVIKGNKHEIEVIVVAVEWKRISLSNDGNELSFEYTLTDPEVWGGEWVSTKTFRREERVDFLEVHCLPNLNEGITATNEKYRVTD